MISTKNVSVDKTVGNYYGSSKKNCLTIHFLWCKLSDNYIDIRSSKSKVLRERMTIMKRLFGFYASKQFVQPVASGNGFMSDGKTNAALQMKVIHNCQSDCKKPNRLTL